MNDSANDSYSEISDPARLVGDPLVSVVMLAFNHEKYLNDAIGGVLLQTTPFPVELIVAEDCSADGTLAVARAWQQRHPELIRVLHSSANAGMHGNLIRAVKAARGRYVAFCEGDDYWCDAAKLADQVAILEAKPGVGIVHSDYIPSHRVLGFWLPMLPAGLKRRTGVPRETLEGDVRAALFTQIPVTTCTAIYRADQLERAFFHDIYSTRWPFADLQLLASVVERSSVEYIDRPTAIYRLSPNSVMRSGWRSLLRLALLGLEFREQYTNARGVPADFYGEYRPSARASTMQVAVLANDRRQLRILVDQYAATPGLQSSRKFERAARSAIVFAALRFWLLARTSFMELVRRMRSLAFLPVTLAFAKRTGLHLRLRTGKPPRAGIPTGSG